LFQQTYASLLDQLAEMPLFLERTLAALPPALLLRPSTRDAYPLIDHLWHVRDCDPDLYGLRIRQVLAEDRPVLEPVDVTAWYGERRYRDQSGTQAISEFAAIRAELIGFLQTLTERDLGRVGMRAGKEVSVLGLVEQIASHDRDHRWRIAAILGEFAAAS